MDHSNEKLISLLEGIMYIRRVEEKICELYSQQEMRCTVHISIGQEATAVGVCAALDKKDMVFSNHRSHGHYLAKEGDLNKFFAELYGKNTGCTKGMGGSMHLIDLSVNFMGATPVVGSIIPVAVGAAWSAQIKKTSQIVVVFIGDGAVEEGVFHESINFAKLKNLPIIFFCENNLYSVYTHLHDRQPDRKISTMVAGHDIKCYEVDGNDVVAVNNIVAEVMEEVRHCHGPVFIEAQTYRWREHCGPNYDNHIGYRTEEEFQKWKLKDPVENCKQKLLKQGIISNENLRVIEQKIDQKINVAVAFAQSSNFPDKNQLGKLVYA